LPVEGDEQLSLPIDSEEHDGWPGVEWPEVIDGICTKHGIEVGSFTDICFACHREQLDAARRGSREHERRP
jgi:hypothetical protein